MQSHSVHLIVRYELLGAYTKPSEESSQSPVVLLPQTDLKRSKVSSHTVHCRVCASSVGSLNAVGPLRENALCFQRKTTSLWRDDVELRGDWSTVIKFASSLVSTRDLNSFYGDAALPDNIASLEGSQVNLVFPTPDALMSVSLRELSLQRPRSYQIECFFAAALRNSIVYLPTGAGKTLVAAMLISLYHKLNPEKVAIFIVDRVPLAHQQGGYLLEQTSLNTLIACGENSDEIPVRKLRSFQVIVVTAEVFINWMIKGWLSMADLNMIVFDEIHHAVKMHPYVRLIEEYYRPCDKLARPRLVGLTASPTEGGPVSMHTSLANLCNLSEANIFMPCVYWEDLLECINRPQIAFHISEPGSQELEMANVISEYCSSMLRTILTKLGVSSSTDVPPSLDSSHFRGFLRALVEKAHGLKCDISVELLLHVQQVYGAQGICSLLGSRYARTYLNDFFIGKQLSFNPIASEQLLRQIQKFDSCSQKVCVLLTILQTINANQDTRAIIFVETKKTARHLCHILEAEAELRAKWKPAYFVGRAAGQVDGMSWVDNQSPTLQKFRSGEHKLLISTSVLQEGIDVPVCDHVILLDQTWTLTSFIQSRGRARAHDSHYLLLCTDAEREAYESLIMTEANMHRVVLQFMASEKTLTKEIALGAIHQACLVAKVENWVSTEHGAVCQGAGADASLNFLQRSYRSIQLTIHNLPLVTEGLTLDSFDFLSDLLLKNMSGELEDDTVFSDKKAFLVRAEPAGSSPLRLQDATKMVSELAARLVVHDAVISYRLGSQAIVGGSGHAFFMAEELQLGTLLSARKFVQLKTLRLTIKVGLNMDLGLIQAYFRCAANQTTYRIDFDLKSVNRFILVEDNPATATTLLYIPIKDAVAFYSAQGKTETDIKLTTLDLLAWERASIQDMAIFADFTDVFTFRLAMTLGRTAKHHMLAVLHRVDAYNLALVYGKVDETGCPSGVLSRKDFFDTSLWTRDFGTGYDFQVLLSTCAAILLYRTPKESFLGPLLQLTPNTRHSVVMELILDLDKAVLPDTISRLQRVIAATAQFNSDSIIPRPYDSSEVTSDESTNSTLVRSVVLTPTRLLYLLPRKMPRNRILRAFNPEYFLQVQFRDENLQRLSTAKSNAGMSDCFERIRDFLRRGLVIADRKYEFLAMSSSQLRDHGCWFVAPHHIVGPSEDGLGLQETYIDAQYITNWCGDFSAIKNVAKYVARLGQSLSASQNISSLPSELVELIPDYEVTSQVRGTSKTFIFSDGVGMLTFALAKKISQKLGLPRVASAYQIRFGGCKGVLAVNPNSTEDDPTEKIWIRPSMVKFASGQHSLEVLNHSSYIPSYLNRQFIIILSSLGVPDQVFLGLQERLLKQMSEMLIESKAAHTAITSCQTILPAISADRIGSNPLYMEPFYRSLLLALYRRMLTELLTRSRAFVPLGRVLMGVIDETGTLDEGEVFVQLSRQPHDSEAITAGLVQVHDGDERLLVVATEITIAKNPCMHPGDVRRLRAVRSPLLEKYHFDCIVFPRKGSRPITDMCSGSDLDGDLYLVTWDPNLLPPRLYEPMDYSPPPAKEVDQVTGEDIINFLVNFIGNDQLGVIANAHVAHSDLLPQGVASPLCMQLAYIFSLAVDFPKTGIVPTFPSEGKVTSWPDFMQKSGLTEHISTKVIGRMFRKVKGISSLAAPLNPERPRLDQSLLAPGYQAYLEASRQLYHEYCDSLSCVLRTYGILEEAPLFTNSHIGLGVGASKEEAKNVLKMVVRSVKEIVSKYRERFHKGTDGNTDLPAKASAWYYVAYTDAVKPRGLSSPILSFPWIVSDYLESIPRAGGGHNGALAATSSYALGEQALRAAVEILDQEVRAAAVERLNFYSLLRNLLQDVVGAGTRIELSGSVNGLFHHSGSDINVFLDIDDQKLSGPVLDQLSKAFRCHHRPGLVEYRGEPFHFTIFNRIDSHKPSLMIRDAFYRRPSLMALVLVITRWGRAQRLLRGSVKHSRHISATTLTLLVCETHVSLANNPGDDLEGRTPATVDEGMTKITDLKGALLGLPTEEVEAVGKMILLFLQRFAFAPNPADLSTSQEENLKLLHEYCFKAYQLLVQSMRIENLWRIICSSDTELDLVLAKKNPKLLRRGKGQQCSVFMDGSSVLLFEGGESQQDAVGFELYQFQRRPQHLTAQCYSPVLATPKLLPQDPSDRESHVYQQYFAHFYRQFDMARRLGSPEYGPIKLAIKYGCSYILNLPRLFREDGTAATVQKVQQALSLGYSAVSEVGSGKFLKGKAGGFALGLPRGKNVLEVEETDPVETDSTDVVEKIIKSLEEGGEPLRSLNPVLSKKKSSLTAMSSSFEPFVVDEERLKAFIAKIGLKHQGGHVSTTISLNLYNSSMDGNCGFQVMYDEQMQLRNMRYQPLRWMVIDVRGKETDGRDYRFVLSSAKDVDLEGVEGQGEGSSLTDTIGGDMKVAIKEGIVELITDGDPQLCTPKLRVRKEFRNIEGLMARVSRTATYGFPDQASISTVLSLSPHLRTVPREVLHNLRLVTSQVVEHSNVDAESGLFVQIMEKSEVSIDWKLDWTRIQQDHDLAISVIPSLWTLAHLFRDL